MTPIFQLSLCPYNAGFTTFNDYLATWTTAEPQVLHWVDIGNLPAGWWDLTVHLKDPGFVAAGRLVAEAVRERLNTTIEGRYTPTGGGITNVGPISGASIKWARNKKNTRITGSVTATPSGAGNCRVDLTGPPAGFFAASEPLGVGAARRVASGALSPAQVISNGSTGLSLLFTATDSSPVLLTFTGDGDALI